jgi:F-type H+-transporting ATPase subunit b
MSTDTDLAKKKTKGAPFGVLLIVGLLLMFGGMYLSVDVTLGFQESLAEQGIPLDIGKTIASIGVFLILFPIVRMFFIDPLAEAISGRQKYLEETFSEADELRNQMTEMKRDYEAQLAETEKKAREEIQKQIREAQDLRTKLMAEANEKAEQLMKKAQEDIANERDKVLTQLRIDVANLTLQATEKIIGENLDNEKNRKIVDDFISEIEVQKN